ncbi:RloB family protein [Bernardetia sp. OM2101]|uniref:RloB family protein n=1 Tax=Bernardetia sp. OM2101 TaxID=3344876 RepID=UPI0035CF4EA3
MGTNRTNKEEKEKKAAEKRAKREARRMSKRLPIELERNEEPILEKLPKKVLIVCEGENTEPSYFKQLASFYKLTFIDTKNIIGTGYTQKRVVEEAEKLEEAERLSSRDNFDEVWCVFDHDPKPDNPTQSQNFNAAIVMAESKGFKVAYSNEAFEFWIILHFEDHQGSAMDRGLYYDKINDYLKEHKLEYNKESKIITPEIFEVLQAIDVKTGKARQDLAVERAQKIHERFEKDDLSRSNPAAEQSSTTVFKMIERFILKPK